MKYRRQEPDFATRRTALRSLAALGASALPLPAWAGEAPSCDGTQFHMRLRLPRDGGLWGWLRPSGSPLALVAATPPAGGRARVEPFAATYFAAHGGVSHFNPTLVLRRGERVRIGFRNNLTQPTIVHWHGLHVDTHNDGNGAVVIGRGEQYDYDFEVRNRSGLYWYHPHPHGTTASQIYRGLFGLVLVEDDDELKLRKALGLALGVTDIPLILQDRRAGGDYAPTETDLVHGFLGNAMTINSTRCAYLDVGTRLYRFRMLNACNARTLLLALRTASGKAVPFTLVGNDGGLIPAPVRCEKVFLATAERIDILVDLRGMARGESIRLETLAFDPMHAEIASGATDAPTEPGHATMGSMPATPPAATHVHSLDGAWAEGAPRALLELRVRHKVAYTKQVPERLWSSATSIDVAQATERAFRLGFAKGRWRINDRVFEMGATPIEVKRDTTETWLIRNYHTSMPHAMHVHGFHFEVLSRETSPDQVAALKVDAQGRLPTDLGRKDTVLVWPGESVRVALDFRHPFAGPQDYLFHCHNLEHEDGGMMLGVRVG